MEPFLVNLGYKNKLYVSGIKLITIKFSHDLALNMIIYVNFCDYFVINP